MVFSSPGPNFPMLDWPARSHECHHGMMPLPLMIKNVYVQYCTIPQPPSQHTWDSDMRSPWIGSGILSWITFYGFVISSLVETSRPQIWHLLMTYTTDLTVVLKSLSDIKLTWMPQVSQLTTGITWSELKEAFEAYKHLGDKYVWYTYMRAYSQLSYDAYPCLLREYALAELL